MGRERSSLWMIIPWLALPLVLIVGRNCASAFYRVGRKKRQIKRDIKAALLLDRLQHGQQERYSLYLRSFAQEEKLKRRKGIWWYVLIEGNIFDIDLETHELMIASELRLSYPMITLGRPGEELGAGRLPSTDADWEALALLLIEQASAILIVPNASKGVIWEMERLKNYHEKTIYIMPPIKYYDGDAGSAEGHWQEAQREFTHRSIHLPAYSSKGALFMLDEQGRVARTLRFANLLGGSNVRRLVSLMRREQKSAHTRNRLSEAGRSMLSMVVTGIGFGRSVITIAIVGSFFVTFGQFIWQSRSAEDKQPVDLKTLLAPRPPDKSFSYDKDGLSFTYYNTWKITLDEIIGGERHILIESNEVTALFLIFLVPPDSPVNLDSFVAFAEKERMSNSTDEAVDVAVTKTLEIFRDISGQTVTGIRQRFVVNGRKANVPHTQDFFLLNTGRVKTLITIQAPDEDWESSDRGFQMIFDSLKIEKSVKAK